MLKLEHGFYLEPEPLNPSNEPCWIDSVDESKSHFDSVVEYLNEWYNFMAQKILNLRACPDVAYRIRKSGKFLFMKCFFEFMKLSGRLKSKPDIIK